MLGSLRSLRNLLFYQSEKKLLITLHFTLKLNVTKFHVCTDYLIMEMKKCSLLATKGQTLGNEHFLLSFLQRIINRQQWEKKKA